MLTPAVKSACEIQAEFKCDTCGFILKTTSQEGLKTPTSCANCNGTTFTKLWSQKITTQTNVVELL